MSITDIKKSKVIISNSIPHEQEGEEREDDDERTRVHDLGIVAGKDDSTVLLYNWYFSELKISSS